MSPVRSASANKCMKEMSFKSSDSIPILANKRKKYYMETASKHRLKSSLLQVILSSHLAKEANGLVLEVKISVRQSPK